MRTSEADILIVPGWSDSGPEHWQSRWEGRLSTARRVVQDDWARPRRDAWVDRLAQAVAAARRPVVLVAHSLGVVAVAHLAAEGRAKGVAGGFLVAPPSEAVLAGLDGVDAAFLPIPREPLPFPAVVVAGATDPYCGAGEAAALASAWGAAFSDAGDSGHLNAASGHGAWPEGLIRFAGFLRGL